MSFLDWINPFNKALAIVDKAVLDKDLRETLRAELEAGRQDISKMAETSYRQALATSTVPWVDALHKMGRQITGYLSCGLAFYMVMEGYDYQAVMAAMAPSSIYAWQKGKGK